LHQRFGTRRPRRADIEPRGRESAGGPGVAGIEEVKAAFCGIKAARSVEPWSRGGGARGSGALEAGVDEIDETAEVFVIDRK